MKPSVYAALQKADEVKTLPSLIALGGAPQRPSSLDAPTKAKFGRGGKVLTIIIIILYVFDLISLFVIR